MDYIRRKYEILQFILSLFIKILNINNCVCVCVCVRKHVHTNMHACTHTHISFSHVVYKQDINNVILQTQRIQGAMFDDSPWYITREQTDLRSRADLQLPPEQVQWSLSWLYCTQWSPLWITVWVTAVDVVWCQQTAAVYWWRISRSGLWLAQFIPCLLLVL